MDVREIAKAVMAEMEATANESFDFVMSPADIAQAEVRPVDSENERVVESAGEVPSSSIQPVDASAGEVPSSSIQPVDASAVETSTMPDVETVQVDQAAVPEVDVQEVATADMIPVESSGPDSVAEIQIAEPEPVEKTEAPAGGEFSPPDQVEVSPVETEQVDIGSPPSGEEFQSPDTAEMPGPDDSVSVQPAVIPDSDEFSPPNSQPVGGDEWSPQQVTDSPETASYSIGDITEGVDSPDSVSMEFSNHVDQPNFHDIAESELNRFRANLEEMVGSQMERMANVALTVAHSASVDMAMMLEARHHQ